MTSPGAALSFTEQRLELFPTRLFRRRFESLGDFNRRMREIVLAKEQEAGCDSMVRSNVGGWHSNPDLLRWSAPEVKVVLELFKSTVMDYVGVELNRNPATFDLVMTMEAWANVTRAGHYTRPHIHPLANFALVYYVDVGDDSQGEHDLGGCLELLDPRSRVTMLTTPGVNGSDSVLVRPRSSTMLAFPAWIYHYVHPYRGESPRISLACNATVHELKDRPTPAEGDRPSAMIIEE